MRLIDADRLYEDLKDYFIESSEAQQAMKEDYEKQIKAENIDIDSVFNICIIEEDCAILDIEQVVTEWFIREIGTDNVSVESIVIHILSEHAFLKPEHERGITFLVCDVLKEQSKNPNKSSYEIIIELLVPENEREKYLTDNWRYKGEQAYFRLINLFYTQGLEREKQICGGEVNLCYNSATRQFKVYHKTEHLFCDIVDPIKISCSGETEYASLNKAIEAWDRRADND